MKRFTIIFLIIAQQSLAQRVMQVVHGDGIQAIVSVNHIAQLTGQPSMNNTGQVNVYGTDLGSMFLHSDGRNRYGQLVNSGMYFYCLQAVDEVQVRKMLLLK
jgi:hypothetical protein